MKKTWSKKSRDTVPLMVLKRANPLLRALQGVGPKKSRFPGPPPSNSPRNGSCPPQNHYVLSHINNRCINSYNLSSFCRRREDGGSSAAWQLLPVWLGSLCDTLPPPHFLPQGFLPVLGNTVEVSTTEYMHHRMAMANFKAYISP
jgi:hypothetical protein